MEDGTAISAWSLHHQEPQMGPQIAWKTDLGSLAFTLPARLPISNLFSSSETSDRSTLSSLFSVSSLPLAEYLSSTSWPGTGGSRCWVYLWPKGAEFIFSYRLWSISKEVFIHMLDGDQSGEMKTSHGR